MFANPSMVQGNVDGLAYKRGISNRAVWHSKGGQFAPVREMLFLRGSGNSVMRGNLTDLVMLFVCCLLKSIGCFFCKTLSKHQPDFLR